MTIIEELQKKYPDVKICNSKSCELTLEEHEVFYQYEQYQANAAKKGMILVYNTSEGKRLYSWYNGKKWVFL